MNKVIDNRGSNHSAPRHSSRASAALLSIYRDQLFVDAFKMRKSVQILTLFLAACATQVPPPSAVAPAAIAVSLPQTYDEVWRAAQAAVNEMRGTVTTESRDLGIIAFYVRWGSVETTTFNLYIRRDGNRGASGVTLHIASWVDKRPGINGEDLRLLRTIRARL